MSRLNRKRKASCEREADKKKSRKVRLERSVAKTLLTLNRRTGKTKDEHAAASALLDLGIEQVASPSGKPDYEESMHEVADRDELTEHESPESHNNDVHTQTDEKLLRECSTQVSTETKNICILVCMFLLSE